MFFCYPPKQIRAVAKTGMLNIAAAGGELYGLKVRRLLWTATHSKHAKVTQLIARGDVLLSLGTDNVVKVWRAATGQLLNEFQPRHDVTPTTMCCVCNYSNKIVLGTQQGHLELWNFNTGTLVHKFPSFSSAVSSLAMSPANDTIGVGLADGRVICYNLSVGKELLRFQHSADGKENVRVTTLSFRTDGPQSLCSGTEYGEIAVWNLAKKKLEGLLTANLQAASPDEVFEPPHTGCVTSVQFLPNEPVLVTSGEDNSLKMYVFDSLQGTGKLLRERRGHHSACTGVQFFDSKILLSYSSDRSLRVSHVFSDLFNREMSQGALMKEAKKRGVQSYDLKLPQVTCLASSLHRTHDWGSVVTGHKGSPEARTWRMDNFTITASKKKQQSGGKNALKNAGASTLVSPNPLDKTSEVTAVCVSQCANFGIIGLSSGRIHVFNLQSGGYEGCYEDQEVKQDKAHAGRVLSLHMMQDNGLVLSVGADHTQKMWSFPPVEGEADEGVNYLRYRVYNQLVPNVTAFNVANQFLAVGGVADVNGTSSLAEKNKQKIEIYDMTPRNIEEGMTSTIVQGVQEENLQAANKHKRIAALKTPAKVLTSKVVRQFYNGHNATITSLVFSTDSRLLFSASLDAAVCVWDIPTDRLIDLVTFPSPITSMSVHPDSYFLATTHTNDQNVYLWTNKVKYGHIPKPVHNEETLRTTVDYKASSGSSLFKLPEVAVDGTFVEEEEDEEDVAMFDPENPGLNVTEELTEAEKRLVELVENGDVAGRMSISKGERVKWKNLVALDQIKKRNAPIAPPKKIDAPFFLPTTAPNTVGGTPTATSRIMSSLKAENAKKAEAENEDDDKPADATPEERATTLADATTTPFLRLVGAGEHDAALDLLLTMGTSKVDMEFRGLADTFFGEEDEEEDEDDALAAETKTRIELVLAFFEYQLALRNNFEFVQACLSVFLKHAGLQAVRYASVQPQLERIELLQKENSLLLSSLTDNALCLMRHFVSQV